VALSRSVSIGHPTRVTLHDSSLAYVSYFTFSPPPLVASGGRRAAEQRYELAPLHSITSSASASSVGGSVRPSDVAVLRLMTSVSLVVCWTGRPAAFSPLRIRPA
jgi:hypothetical protein